MDEFKSNLEFKDLWELNLCKRDSGGRWFACHEIAQQYVNQNEYRNPSRAWPHSHSKPLLTKKFCKFVKENHPCIYRAWFKIHLAQ